MSRSGDLSVWRLLAEQVDWMERGACRTGGASTAVFFVQDGKRDLAEVRAAKAWCDLCEVKAECLAYALERPALYGVWGGTTESQRNRARRAARNSGAA